MTFMNAFVLCSVLSLAACGGGTCPVGSQGCACTTGKGCDPGLDCNAQGFCSGGRSTGNDGSMSGNDGSTSGGAKRVFITSTAYDGGFGSITSGDGLCGSAAIASALGGSWVAWLSDPTTNAYAHVNGTGPWKLLDGTTVFGTAAQLRTTPSVLITLDETGGTHGSPEPIWTGTQTGGSDESDEDCISWSNNGSMGLVGTLDGTSTWTAGSSQDCGDPAHLYCFEQ
jgi:hypothetical protein